MNSSNNGKPKTLSDFSPFLQSSLLNAVPPVANDAGDDEAFEDEDLDDEDFVEKVFGVIDEADKAEAVVTVIGDVSGVEEIADVEEIGGQVLGAVGGAKDIKDAIPKNPSSSWFSKLCKCGGSSKKKPKEDVWVSVKQSAA